MNPNSNFSELLSLFEELGVRYLVVGGYALMNYTEPRYTKDIDLWIQATPENGARVFQALLRFGAPLAGIVADDFSTPGLIYQMGRPPIRVDVLTSLSGVEFLSCWERRATGRFGSRDVYVISIDDLIVNKRKVGRLQDLADVERLEATRREK
ncbi:MAG: nucleotidyltransferase [Bryobacteraceae bacterium]